MALQRHPDFVRMFGLSQKILGTISLKAFQPLDLFTDIFSTCLSLDTAPPNQYLTHNLSRKYSPQILCRYKFHIFPLNPAYFLPSDGPLANDSYTVRDTTTNVNINLSRASLMSSTVSSTRHFGPRTLLINDSQYYTLSKDTRFDTFCTGFTPGPSLEDIHNSIHGIVGGANGHMSQLTYAAFDPIL